MNEEDPYKENSGVILEKANEELNVYLIKEAEAENFEKWISLNSDLQDLRINL